jgi:agmatinase
MSGFLGIEDGDPAAEICIAGIPYDLGVSGRRGARFGPAAIRRASHMLIGGDHPTVWHRPAEGDIADIGDFFLPLEVACPDLDAARLRALAVIEAEAAPLNHLIALGGDHSVTLALLRALTRRTGRLALVHFDAHVDTWPEVNGERYGHGSPFFHAIEEGLIDPRRTVQIGVRSPVARAVRDWTVGRGVTILSAEDVHERGPQATAARIRAVIGNAPAYLTFDIDALDPAFAPGTGTPEVGGLATWQAQAIIRRLAGIDFRGMDVVEVSPPDDHAEITALAAATVAWEYLALIKGRQKVMEDWQNRVIKERAELNEKLAAIVAFISSGDPRFDVLPEEDKGLLRRQRDAMRKYSDILEVPLSNVFQSPDAVDFLGFLPRSQAEASAALASTQAPSSSPGSMATVCRRLIRTNFSGFGSSQMQVLPSSARRRPWRLQMRCARQNGDRSPGSGLASGLPCRSARYGPNLSLSPKRNERLPAWITNGPTPQLSTWQPSTEACSCPNSLIS